MHLAAGGSIRNQDEKIVLLFDALTYRFIWDLQINER